MSQILLNKFEKRVIQLHLQGKIIRDIAKKYSRIFFVYKDNQSL